MAKERDSGCCAGGDLGGAELELSLLASVDCFGLGAAAVERHTDGTVWLTLLKNTQFDKTINYFLQMVILH